MSWMGGGGSFESRAKAQSKQQGSVIGRKDVVARDGEVMERDSFANRAASLFSSLPSSSPTPAPDGKKEAAPPPTPPVWVVSGVCELPDRRPDPEEDPEQVGRECDSPDSSLSEEEGCGLQRAAQDGEGQGDEEDDAPVVITPQQERGGRERPAQQRYVPPGRSSLKSGTGGAGAAGTGGGGDPPAGGSAAAVGEGHKRIRFSDDVSSRSRGGDAPNQAGATEGSRTGNGKPCFSFSQTGKCKFGERCRFTHTLPDHVANPERYKRYEVDWSEEDSGGGANKAAAMATLELARMKREGEAAVDPAEERAAFERDRLEREKRMEAKKRKMADGEGKGGAGGKKKAKGGGGAQLSFAEEEEGGE